MRTATFATGATSSASTRILALQSGIISSSPWRNGNEFMNKTSADASWPTSTRRYWSGGADIAKERIRTFPIVRKQTIETRTITLRLDPQTRAYGVAVKRVVDSLGNEVTMIPGVDPLGPNFGNGPDTSKPATR